MSWRIAKSLLKLREQINAAAPGRDKSSDGGIGDANHASRKSDHNPWVKDGQMGVVTAIDIDEDLNTDGTLMQIVDAIRESHDPRVKYIIYEGQITVPGDITRWKPYSGVNAHRHHAHVSVNSAKALYDDEREWAIHGSIALPVVPDAGSFYTVQAGDSLWKIAGHFKVTVDALRRLNNMAADASLITPGQKLRVKI